MSDELKISKRDLLQGLSAALANTAMPARAAVVATAATQALPNSWFIEMAWKFVMYSTRLDRHGIIGSAGAVDGFAQGLELARAHRLGFQAGRRAGNPGGHDQGFRRRHSLHGSGQSECAFYCCG